MNSYFFKNTLVKNISYLTIGQIISQIISLISVFYIPKLLGVEQYGNYQTVLSFVSIFTVFSFTGLNKVALRSGSMKIDKLSNEIESIIGIRHLFTFFAAMIAVLSAIFLDYSNEIIIYISIYVSWLWLRTFESTINLVYQAHEKLKYFAFFTVLKSILLALSLVTVLLVGKGIFELLIVDLIVSLFVIVISYYKSKRFTEFNFFSKVEFNLKKLKEGFIFSLLSFFNVLGNKIDVVMISLLGSPLEVGLYALANSVVRKGLLASRAISTSIFPIYAKQAFKSLTRVELNKHSFYSFSAALIVVLFIYFGADWFINNIIGSDFSYSATIIKVLSLYLLFHYISLPYDTALQVTFSENTLLKIRFSLAFLNILANYIFYDLFGIIGIAYSSLLVKLTNMVLILIKSYFSIPYYK